MRKKLSLIAIGIAVLIHGSVSAQTLLSPSTHIKGSAADQNLNLYYTEVDNTVRGRLLYAGGNSAGARYFGFINQSADYLGFFSPNTVRFHISGIRHLAVGAEGVTVGSNSSETAVRLTVNGSVDVKGNIAAKYQDLAEWVPSFGDPDAGTVVIVAEEAVNHVAAASIAYDTRIAGVVSAQPGVILGEAGPSRVMVATTGRVKVKADATRSSIQIGDLLVTSDRTGYAMKSEPIDIGGIVIHRPGTLIGKALEPLSDGTGEILVLLSLQ
jgi:hypothetical protein